MERSVLEMLSDRSSALTLLGCRPSARKSLGRSQERLKLLTRSSFCSLHHDNNHSFKANLSCPRRYVGRGPGTYDRHRGRCVSIRLLKSLFSVSISFSLLSFTPACSTTDPTLSSPFRIVGICAETSRTRAPGKQWVCTLPSANVAQTCRTIKSPMTTASRSVSQRGTKLLRFGELEDWRRWGRRSPSAAWICFFHCCTQGLWFPALVWRTTGKIASRVHGACAEKQTE